jgi:ubiquinone/menaquinone biosynthesis C-methylase UbiE
MTRLDLASLRPIPGERLRILEVGIGAGANLSLLDRDLPPYCDVEIWGLDLSVGMLERCRRRLAQDPGRPVRLLLADAHALPFPDACFDRVFHVGGIGGYGNPGRGLAEMARVARPGTPILVVDEQLDPAWRTSPFHRLVFRALTFYASESASPVGDLPPGATDVVSEQLSRYYYGLTFRMPSPGT